MNFASLSKAKAAIRLIVIALSLTYLDEQGAEVAEPFFFGIWIEGLAMTVLVVFTK